LEDDSPKDDIATKVRAALVQVDRRFGRRELLADMSLVDDLGMDSIRFLDLTFAIEDLLNLTEFPIQQWVDAESTRSGPRFTVRSLVAFCAMRVEVEAFGCHRPLPTGR
jgi:acyl carrier protein